MKEVILKSTTNIKFEWLRGMRGFLDEKGGLFSFYYDLNGSRYCLKSKIVRQLGYINDIRCDEVVYITNNSEYVFSKINSDRVRLFDYVNR